MKVHLHSYCVSHDVYLGYFIPKWAWNVRKDFTIGSGLFPFNNRRSILILSFFRLNPISPSRDVQMQNVEWLLNASGMFVWTRLFAEVVHFTVPTKRTLLQLKLYLSKCRLILMNERMQMDNLCRKKPLHIGKYRLSECMFTILWRNENRFRCRECQTEFCASCHKTPYHLGFTCEKVQKSCMREV